MYQLDISFVVLLFQINVTNTYQYIIYYKMFKTLIEMFDKQIEYKI